MPCTHLQVLARRCFYAATSKQVRRKQALSERRACCHEMEYVADERLQVMVLGTNRVAFDIQPPIQALAVPERSSSFALTA